MKMKHKPLFGWIFQEKNEEIHTIGRECETSRLEKLVNATY